VLLEDKQGCGNLLADLLCPEVGLCQLCARQENPEGIFAEIAHYVATPEVCPEDRQNMREEELAQAGKSNGREDTVAVKAEGAERGIGTEEVSTFELFRDPVAEALLSPDTRGGLKPQPSAELLVPVAVFQQAPAPEAEGFCQFQLLRQEWLRGLAVEGTVGMGRGAQGDDIRSVCFQCWGFLRMEAMGMHAPIPLLDVPAVECLAEQRLLEPAGNRPERVPAVGGSHCADAPLPLVLAIEAEHEDGRSKEFCPEGKQLLGEGVVWLGAQLPERPGPFPEPTLLEKLVVLDIALQQTADEEHDMPEKAYRHCRIRLRLGTVQTEHTHRAGVQEDGDTDKGARAGTLTVIG
jgi:hypothetical protein